MATEEVGSCICAVFVFLQSSTATGNVKEHVKQYLQNQILEKIVSKLLSQNKLVLCCICMQCEGTHSK